MAAAIEDAGFIIHPTIFCWVFGSGFPKATRIDDQVDKALGLEQEVVDRVKATAATGGVYGTYAQEVDITVPNSPEAQAWATHRYGLQAMKPAVEPIILFQKPYSGKPVANMMASGAGAINVDGARIGDEERSYAGGELGKYGIYSKMERHTEPIDVIGRWPANFAVTHTEDCTTGNCVCIQSIDNSEYFQGSTWQYEVYEQLMGSPLARYFAKAGKAERNAGLSDRETQVVTDGRHKPHDSPHHRGVTQRQNPHPTIKPITLNQWLASLLLPPDLYAPRRILVPFSGVGSEVIGAQMAGWEQVDGIEMQEEYVDIARQRIAWWDKVSGQLNSTRIEAILEYAERQRAPKQGSLEDLPLFKGLI
jgi:site-specific DNA-methyltransferase (adenine-specific)